ncbi:MAG: hypothetical protein RBT69_06490 [Spirochaetia bacterium]|nr:hypothetical protein [Spirochaetia bacterium]
MTVLKTYDDRCEVRIAPFQGILKIEYKEILNVFEEKNLLVLLLDSGKKVKVSMSSFNSFERADVFNLFKNQCVR